MQLNTFAMHPHVGNAASRGYNRLAGIEGCRDAHRLNRHIHPYPLGQLEDAFNGILRVDINHMGRAKTLRNFKTIGVAINHDQQGGRVKLRRQQGGHAHRARPDYHHTVTRLDLAGEHADLEAGRQNVAEHHQRFFIRAGGYRVQAVVGMGNTHIFGLGTVNRMAQNPAAVSAMGVHLPPAVGATAA